MRKVYVCWRSDERVGVGEGRERVVTREAERRENFEDDEEEEEEDKEERDRAKAAKKRASSDDDAFAGNATVREAVLEL